MAVRQCIKFIWLPIFILFVGLYIVLWMQSTPELTWLVWMRVKASYQLTGLVGVGCFALLAAWTGLSQREPNDRLLNIAVALGLRGITVRMLEIFAEGVVVAPRVITPVIRSDDDDSADDSGNLLNSKYLTTSTVAATSFDKIDGKTVEINGKKYSVNDSNRVRTRYRPGQTAEVVITNYYTKKSVPKYIREMIHEQSTDFLSMHQITTPEQDQAAYRTIMIEQPSK